MKSKAELEQISKHSPQELIKLKQSLVIEIASEKAKIVAGGQKSTDKLRLMRKKIARIETVLSQKLIEQVSEGGE